MKIRHKFGVGFVIIFIFSFISLNLIINKVKVNFIVNEIKEEMNSAYKNTYRFINSYAQYNLIDITINNFISHAPEIALNVSEDKKCNFYVINKKDEVIYKYNIPDETINYDVNRIIKCNSSALENKNLLDIYYYDDRLSAATIFPLYMDGNYIATIVLIKDFTQYYIGISSFIGLLKVLNLIIFIVMIIAVYLLSGKIVKPLILLRKSFKEVENGEYNGEIFINSKDEVGDLSKGFSEMKNKIKNQIETINNEKEKILALESSRIEFFNNVTHELKTPLTTISGYTQILRQDNFNDKDFHDYALERIEKESERMHKLVSTLIEVSKNNSKIDKEGREFVNLKEILDDIIFDLSIKANRYKITIDYSIEETNFICVEDDMRRLFINIIDNAIKYSLSSTTIKVESKVKENYYIFSVSNLCDEISEEGIKNVFQPFYREDIRKARELGSNGLGLFICSQIVEKYGGDINFNYYSEKVTVLVKFPIK